MNEYTDAIRQTSFNSHRYYGILSDYGDELTEARKKLTRTREELNVFQNR